MPAEDSRLLVWLAAALAVLCNAAAQVLIKYASWPAPSPPDAGPPAAAGLSWLGGLNAGALLMALALYAVSFALTAWVYARLPLSVASPLMAGAIFVLISVASVFWFAETLTALRVAGMLCIVMGVLLLSRSA